MRTTGPGGGGRRRRGRLPVVECADVTESGSGEGVSDGGEDPIAGGRVVACREAAGGMECSPLPHLGCGGGADVAVEIDGEGEEAEVRVTSNLIAILVGLSSFATRHDISAVLRRGGDDCAIDRETGTELRVSFDPDVGRSALVGIEDLARGAGGGPAGGRSTIADCGRERVVAPLCVTGGLKAGECVLTERVEVRPRTLTRTRTSRRSCWSAAAQTAAEVWDAGGGVDDGESEEAADPDELKIGRKGEWGGRVSELVGRRARCPDAPEVDVRVRRREGLERLDPSVGREAEGVRAEVAGGRGVPVTNVECTPPGRIERGAGPTDDEIDVGRGGGDALSVAKLCDLRSHGLAHLRDGAADKAAIVGGWEDAGDITPKVFPVGVDGGPEFGMAGERAEDVIGHAGRAAEGDSGGGGEVGVEYGKEAEAGELGGIALAPGTEAGELVADGDAGDESPVDGGFGVAGCDGVGGEGADGFVFGVGPSGAVGRRSAAESVDGSGREDGGPTIVMEFTSHTAWDRGKRGVGVGEGLEERRLRGALRESVVVAEAERGDEVGGARERGVVGGRGVCGLSRGRGLGRCGRWRGMGERRSSEGASEEFDERATRCGALLR